MSSVMCRGSRATRRLYQGGGAFVWRGDELCSSGIAPGLVEQLIRLPVAVQRPDVDVRLAGADAGGAPAEREVGVHERAEVLVARIARAPELVQLAEHAAAQPERPPDPVRRRARLLHLNLHH